MNIWGFLISRRRKLSQANCVRKSGLFDARWYLKRYRDVAESKIDPLQHYMEFGAFEGRSPGPDFDAEWYLSSYPDIRGINPLLHYINHGRAEGRQPLPLDRRGENERIRASGLFNSRWYSSHYKDVAASKMDPFEHFTKYGSVEGLSPGPKFDAGWYLASNPDIAGMNALLHYIDHGRREGRHPVRPENLIEIAKKTVASIEDLDPEILDADFFDDPGRLRFAGGQAVDRFALLFKSVVEKIGTPPRAVVFLPWIVHGGADLVASHAIAAIAAKFGPEAVLVVLTDHDREEALHLFPEKVQIVSFSRISHDMTQNERADLVDLLVRSLKAETVLNVNSQACWTAVKRNGRRLAHFSRLYAALFCQDFSANGKRIGYSDLYLRDCLPFLSAVYFDNQTHIDQVSLQFSIPSDFRKKLVLLRQPAPRIQQHQQGQKQEGRPAVFWAGRLAPQKNVDLLLRIVESAPDIDFHVWGRGSRALELRLATQSHRLENLFFHGPFENFLALPVHNYHGFLYTSLWDGLPNTLLEAASAGVPIVASNAGGIAELIDESTGWLIDDLHDEDPYVEALREVIASPREASLRTAALQRRLELNHDSEHYLHVLLNEPLDSESLLA